MANEDDFTFCRVEPPVDVVEAQKITDDIREVRIVDGNETVLDRNSNSENGGIWRGSSAIPKEGKVGSLSFSVTETSSSRKEPTQRATFAVQEGSGSSTSELKAPVKKSVTRAKVPFEKGYSQMDWLKLTRTHPDLADLKGQSNKRLISLNEVKQHKSEGSMWTVLKGRVYNLSPYMNFHPGGDDILKKAVGRDCTALFNKYHAWVNAEFLLEKCLVGMLDQGQ